MFIANSIQDLLEHLFYYRVWLYADVDEIVAAIESIPDHPQLFTDWDPWINGASRYALPHMLRIGACIDSILWVGTRTLEEAWMECSNPVWLLWYLDRTGEQLDDVAEALSPDLGRGCRLACLIRFVIDSSDDDMDLCDTIRDAVGDCYQLSLTTCS